MRLVPASLALIALLLTVGGSSAAADNYGAIAYDPASGAWGVAWDQASQDAADRLALGDCSKFNGLACAVVARITKGCGAYASGARGGGWGYAPTREAAERNALNYCRSDHGDCELIAWMCNNAGTEHGKAVCAGSAEEQYRQGMKYREGRDVKKDDVKAVQCFQAAAEQNHMLAQLCLGQAYDNGEGVEQSYELAPRWLTKAADQDCADAQTDLGVMYYAGKGVEKNIGRADELWRKAAAQGGVVAMSNLGFLYRDGEGVKQDYAEARRWFLQATDRGYAPAEDGLGLMYEKGWGVEADMNQALQWFRKAAAKEHRGAQYHLGEAYEQGYGVDRDFQQAFDWYTKSANQGDKRAQVKLKFIEYKLQKEKGEL